MKKKAIKLSNKIFKVEAQGDTVYIGAPTIEDADLKLAELFGPTPHSLLTFTEVKKLPKGEELL